MEQEVKHMPPQKTWFFTDSTGRTFSTNEKEAYSLLTSNSGWRRQDIKMVGCSDGTTFYRVVNESKHKIAELEKEVKQKRSLLERYITGHDKLLFDEFLDEEDDRVKRAKKKISEIEKELEPIEKEYTELKRDILKKAEEAELEVARGNMERPKEFKVIRKGDKVSDDPLGKLTSE